MEELSAPNTVDKEYVDQHRIALKFAYMVETPGQSNRMVYTRVQNKIDDDAFVWIMNFPV